MIASHIQRMAGVRVFPTSLSATYPQTRGWKFMNGTEKIRRLRETVNRRR